VLRNFFIQGIHIRTHHFIHFLSIAEELKGGHRTDPTETRHIVGFVDIDFRKYDRVDFIGQFFENRADVFARSAPFGREEAGNIEGLLIRKRKESPLKQTRTTLR
jgi:hypothetical protein